MSSKMGKHAIQRLTSYTPSKSEIVRSADNIVASKTDKNSLNDLIEDAKPTEEEIQRFVHEDVIPLLHRIAVLIYQVLLFLYRLKDRSKEQIGLTLITGGILFCLSGVYVILTGGIYMVDMGLFWLGLIGILFGIVAVFSSGTQRAPEL